MAQKSKYDLIEFINIINQSKLRVSYKFIDNDGLMNGYDFNLISLIHNKMNIPITILGGAENEDHIKNLYKKYKNYRAAAGVVYLL